MIEFKGYTLTSLLFYLAICLILLWIYVLMAGRKRKRDDTHST
jgi:cbb3-type cytochrome oxidase subunit 3